MSYGQNKGIYMHFLMNNSVFNFTILSPITLLWISELLKRWNVSSNLVFMYYLYRYLIFKINYTRKRGNKSKLKAKQSFINGNSVASQVYLYDGFFSLRVGRYYSTIMKKRRGEMLDHHVKHSQRQGSRNWNFEITKEAGFQHMTEHLLQVNFVFLLWRLWSRWGLLSWRGEVGRGVSGAAVCGQQIQQRILTLNNSKAKRYCEITLRLLYNNSKKLRGTVKSNCGYCTITAKSYEVQWNQTAVIVL